MSINKRLISTGGAAVCTTDSTDPFGDSSGVALYSLDYDASEASGTYDGTPTNVDFGVGGKINYGARFNGSSSKIDLPSTVVDSIKSNSSFAVSAWFNTSVTGTRKMIFSSFDSTYVMLEVTTGNQLKGIVSNSVGTNTELTISTTVTDGNWHHALFTGENGNLKLYLDNGTPQTSASWNGTFFNGTGGTDIGSRAGNDYFNGSIDQVRIFNKALNQSEVDSLFAETACVYTATTTDNDYPLADGSSDAVAYYKLDNSAEDEKGSYDGTETDIEYRFGRYGQAAVFNGSSSYIESGISTNILNSNYTISFWGKSSNSSGGQTFINTSNGSVAFVRIDFSASGNLYFYHRNSASTAYFDASIVSGMADGNWHHVVITKDNTNVKVYKDGSLVGTITSTSGTYSNSTTFQFGRNNYNTNGGNNFDGSIDQVRIFSTALSDSQVAELYNEKPEVDTSNFKTVLWSGTSAENYISQVGLDLETNGGLVWIKQRSAIDTNHRWFDSIRGVTQIISSSTPDAQGSNSETLKSFEKNGFILGTNTAVNDTGDTFVAWVWKGGGEAVQNTQGTITSDVSANTEAGFSIVKYTGNGTVGATIGHGLSSAPEFSIIKKIDTVGFSGGNWVIGYGSYNTDLYLNSSAAAGTNNYFWNSAPTTTVLEVKNDWFVNYNGAGYISYNFHSVAGYSKIGSYTGNGSSTGPIVYTTDDGTSSGSNGFEPRWVMIKRTNDTGNWYIVDSIRSTANPRNDRLLANTNNSEVSYTPGNIDFLSNGFQLKGTYGSTNALNGTYIYMAFK